MNQHVIDYLYWLAWGFPESTFLLDMIFEERQAQTEELAQQFRLHVRIIN